ncbi:MAG TPA: DUF6491 family protein [Gammaproteobacteria bacterium]|nr:DUF6491 family protein [Gammaproteobacteria bacterium]
MKQRTTFGVAACAALLASCASMTGGDKPRLGSMLGDTTGQKGRACIKVNDIKGYGVLEDNVISIEGKGEHYLATVQPGCSEISQSAQILFSGDFGEVCGEALDEIVAGEERCTINQLFEFNNREAAMKAYHASLERRDQFTNDQPTG